MSHIEHLRSGVSGTFISETLVQRGLYHLNLELEKLDEGDTFQCSETEFQLVLRAGGRRRAGAGCR